MDRSIVSLLSNVYKLVTQINDRSLKSIVVLNKERMLTISYIKYSPNYLTDERDI